jgi:hypothetical protein
LGVLQNSPVGLYFYNLFVEKAISVVYQDLTPLGALGMYVPTYWPELYPGGPFPSNTVYLDSTAGSSWTKEALAAVLIHEAIHADYDHYTDKWVEATVERYGIDASELNWSPNPATGEMVLLDSVDQEYNAFVQAALLWQEVKGSQTNEELDYILALYLHDQENGTMDLYAQVAMLYGGLPPYQVGLT